MTAAAPFEPAQLPDRFCNLDRLLHAMEARGLDGIIINLPLNMYYLTGFSGIAHKADEPRPYALVFSRHQPDHPIIVCADYYLGTFLNQPGWVKDVRPYRAVMMPMDLPAERTDIERFIPVHLGADPRMAASRERFSFDMGTAMRGAVADLGLSNAHIGFDDVGYGMRLELEWATVRDAYDAVMFARAVKTAPELEMLQRATHLNEAAIRATMASWDKGATWRDLDLAYQRAVSNRGGFVRDPGGMVWGHPRGTDPALTLRGGTDDGEVEEGTHVMFDCHGTLDLYCWDGGKSWRVDGEPEGAGKQAMETTARAAEALVEAMRPGAKISELQALGRDAYAKAGAPQPDMAIVFFHGLGLSHMDLELALPDGTPNGDWVLEENMVVPLHLLYPGGQHDRWWLEDVVHVTKDGGKPLFSWGFGALTE
jgi:Xaa-Pro dipeptidase